MGDCSLLPGELSISITRRAVQFTILGSRASCDLLGHDLLQRLGFPTQILDLAARRRPRNVSRKAPLASLQELIGISSSYFTGFPPAFRRILRLPIRSQLRSVASSISQRPTIPVCL